jgi:preprotein translocase subunit YajC
VELAILWFVLMGGTFYLLLWRPQQRRVAAVRALQGALRVGDDVVTTSGIYGRVTRLDDEVVDLEVAPGTVLRIARGAIGQRLTDESPAAEGP